jgi:hypothetical protein
MPRIEEELRPLGGGVAVGIAGSGSYASYKCWFTNRMVTFFPIVVPKTGLYDVYVSVCASISGDYYLKGYVDILKNDNIIKTIHIQIIYPDPTSFLYTGSFSVTKDDVLQLRLRGSSTTSIASQLTEHRATGLFVIIEQE